MYKLKAGLKCKTKFCKNERILSGLTFLYEKNKLCESWILKEKRCKESRGFQTVALCENIKNYHETDKVTNSEALQQASVVSRENCKNKWRLLSRNKNMWK